MSKLGKSKHQLWHELCELIAKNPEKVIGSTVCVYVRTYVCIYVCMLCVCMYVCVYVCMCVCILVHKRM